MSHTWYAGTHTGARIIHVFFGDCSQSWLFFHTTFFAELAVRDKESSFPPNFPPFSAIVPCNVHPWSIRRVVLVAHFFVHSYSIDGIFFVNKNPLLDQGGRVENRGDGTNPPGPNVFL